MRKTILLILMDHSFHYSDFNKMIIKTSLNTISRDLFKVTKFIKIYLLAIIYLNI